MISINDNMDFVDMFEEKLCEYTKFEYAVAVDCCTNGILITLEMLQRYGVINKNDIMKIPQNTYMSIPMTLKNNGWNIVLDNIEWEKSYTLGNTSVYDAATDFNSNMALEYPEEAFVCVSFQQKKRLSLGRGGVIFFNNKTYLNTLKRLRYDGRYPKLTDSYEIQYFPGEIKCGYHCYMEPDKAAKGILELNQLTKPYDPKSFKDYADLSVLEIFK